MNIRAQAQSPIRTAFREYVQDVFAVDARSLALLRISLGLIILIDLINRFSTLELFYTDNGIFTRQMSKDYLGGVYWSVYWLDGSELFAKVLFGINFIAAIGLIVGFKTRWMTAICLVLAWSLQIRNPLVLTAGHVLLRMTLFWSLFLPLGQLWSLDSKRKKITEPVKICSVATAAILLQLAMVYFFSGIAKLNETWFDGFALEYALHLEMYCKPFGQWLRGFPVILTVITYGTLILEIVGPILLFTPGVYKFARGVLSASFVLMHLGIWLTMSIGIFSIMAIVSWILYVPSEVWSHEHPEASNDKQKQTSSGVGLIGQLVCSVFLTFVILLNIANVSPQGVNEFVYSALQRFGQATMTIQEFKMFGQPPTESIWVEHRGQTENGTWLDLITQEELYPDREPDSIFLASRSQHWRRIYWNLFAMPEAKEAKIRERILELMSERWNESHPKNEILRSEISVYTKPILLNENWDMRTKSVWASWSRRSDNKKSRQE